MKMIVTISGKSFEFEGEISFGDDLYFVGDPIKVSFKIEDKIWELTGGKVTEITDEDIYVNGIKFPRDSCNFERP